MRIQYLLDEELPKQHGNRRGLSYGQLLRTIVGCTDAGRSPTLCRGIMGTKHHQTLEMATGWEIRDKL